MVRGEYWWIYYQASTVDWSQWRPGETVPVNEGSCENILHVPAPDDAVVIACIPGEMIRTFQVDMPVKNRRKFLSSLPYALEDKLLHPSETYHFVPVKKDKKNIRLPVAVIARHKLESVISEIKHKNWNLNFVTADFLYIKEPDPDCWLVDATQSPLLLRCCYPDLGSVLSGELSETFHPALRLALEQSAKRPGTLQVRVKDEKQSAAVDAWGEELKKLDVQMKIMIDPSPRANWLARNPVPGNEVNLLTGQYSKQTRGPGPMARLIPAAGLSAAIIITLMLQFILTGNRVKTEYNQLNTALEETYREIFPQTRNLIDPRYQMEQALLQLRSTTQKNPNDNKDFLSQLELLASQINSQTGIFQQLEFDGQKLTVDLEIGNYEHLEELQRRLSSYMNVSIENAEITEGRVKTRIHLENKT